MSTKTQVNAEEFVLLLGAASVEEVTASFELVSAGGGVANVTARAAQPTPVANPTLTAQVATLYAEGRPVAATKGSPPRSKVVLGDRDGIAPYRVIITRAKEA